MGGGDHARALRRPHASHRPIAATPFAYHVRARHAPRWSSSTCSATSSSPAASARRWATTCRCCRPSCRPAGACWRPGARAAAWWCTRARRTGPTCRTARRPSATAATRACASATPGPMGRILVRRRAGQPDHPGAGAACAGEIVIDKPGKGAFYATGLHETAAGARHHAPGVHGRDHRGLRADLACARPTTAATTACCWKTAPRATSPPSRRPPWR